MNNYMEKVTEIAEALGWSVTVDGEDAERREFYEIL